MYRLEAWKRQLAEARKELAALQNVYGVLRENDRIAVLTNRTRNLAMLIREYESETLGKENA